MRRALLTASLVIWRKQSPMPLREWREAENWANSLLLFCWLQGPFITKLSADSIHLESVAPPKMLPNSKSRFKELSHQSQTCKQSFEMGQTPFLKQSVFPMKLLLVLVLTQGCG